LAQTAFKASSEDRSQLIVFGHRISGRCMA
jgi:hypothetical protein